MLQVNFTPFPVLTTERLVLRRMGVEDAPEVFFQRSDPGILQYLDREPVKTLDEVMTFIALVDKGIDENDAINWAITLKGNPKLIGTICFWNINKNHYRGELGYVLHPKHQGQGIMGEAIRAVLQYGFDTMKLHSAEANVNPANSASIRVLERQGFVREAYFRENYYYRGKFIDSAIYSLIG